MRLPAVFLTLALTTTPTCASLPQHELVRLPALPPIAMSAAGPVPIRLTHDLHCVISHVGTAGLDTIKADGCYHYPTRVIEIDDALSRPDQWLTLRHEIVHSTLHAKHLTLPDPDQENAIADAMAQQQVGEMVTGWPRTP